MTPVDAEKRLVIVGATGMVGGYALRYALDHGAVGKHLAGRHHRGTNRGCSGGMLIELHIPVHLLIPVPLPIYYF